MPIYEYRCECGHQYETIRTVENRDKQLDCTQCGLPMQRLVSRTSFALKGQGWERDGYFREKKK